VPPKTNTDAIRELEQLVATLRERLDNTREEVKRVREEQARSGDLLGRLETRLSVAEEKFAEWKKAADEADRRRWQVWVALIGATLSLLGNIVIWYVKR